MRLVRQARSGAIPGADAAHRAWAPDGAGTSSTSASRTPNSTACVAYPTIATAGNGVQDTADTLGEAFAPLLLMWWGCRLPSPTEDHHHLPLRHVDRVPALRSGAGSHARCNEWTCACPAHRPARPSGLCAVAIDAAERGFAPGQPDDELPAACGIFGGLRPDQCRWPRPAEPARGAQAVLDADGATEAPDRACAVLRDAVGQLPLGPGVDYAASRTGACYALSAGGYTVTLDFFPASPATDYCRLGSLRREPVVLAGRAGFECQPGESSRHLILPAFAGAADRPGVLLIDGTLRTPRGLRLSGDLRDRSMVTALTDQIAGYVIANYLG